MFFNRYKTIHLMRALVGFIKLTFSGEKKEKKQ